MINALKANIDQAVPEIARVRALYTLRSLAVPHGLRIEIGTENSEADIYIGQKLPEVLSGTSPKLHIPINVTSLINPSAFSPNDLKEKLGCYVFNPTASPPFTQKENARQFHFDILGQAFWLLTGGHETSHTTMDFLHKSGAFRIPIIDHNSRQLFKPFNTENNLDVWSGPSFAVALTHDVDYPYFIRWKEFAKSLVSKESIAKLIRVAFGKPPDFWQFDSILQAEDAFGFKSAFYFCPSPGSFFNYFLGDFDTFYSLADERIDRIIHQLVDMGWEVGLHASCQAHRDSQLFKTEIDSITAVKGHSRIGNRHHCWRLDRLQPNRTLALHSDLGLSYDSSLKVQNVIGYRRGTAFPFHPFDMTRNSAIATLQLTPVLMDDDLMGRGRAGKASDAKKEIDNILLSSSNMNGLLVTDWHQRMMNGSFYPTEKSAYLYLLDRLNELDCLVATPMEITEYWLARERLLGIVSTE